MGPVEEDEGASTLSVLTSTDTDVVPQPAVLLPSPPQPAQANPAGVAARARRVVGKPSDPSGLHEPSWMIQLLNVPGQLCSKRFAPALQFTGFGWVHL